MTEPLTMPGTVTQRAPIGSLLKKAYGTIPSPSTRNTGSEPSYLDLVRQLPCLRCGMEPSEAAHVRMQSGAHGKRSGMGKRPDDKYALPLCAACHRLDPDSQHKIGEREFWARIGINPLLVCEKLHDKAGDPVAMRAVIFVAMAERENAAQMRGSVR